MKIKTNALIKQFSLIVLITILLFSCQKSINDQQATEKQDLIETYRQKLQGKPTETTQILKLPGKGFYGDINGNRITTIIPNGGRGNASSCPEPSESEFEQELYSITRMFYCGSGYSYQIRYKIISEFTPLYNGGSPFYNISFGRIKLYNNASNTAIYTTPSTDKNPIVDIQNNGVVGQNSNGDDMNEFILTFYTEEISLSTFNSATRMKAMIFAYTDCPNYASIQIPYSGDQTVSTTTQNALPCSRTDAVYFNVQSGSSPSNLSGVNPIGSSCFPSGYIYPNKQEIEFKKTDGNWGGHFNLYLTGLNNPSSTKYLIDYVDIWYIDGANSAGLGSQGTKEVRYRNNHNVAANGGPCTSAWVYTTWYINW